MKGVSELQEENQILVVSRESETWEEKSRKSISSKITIVWPVKLAPKKVGFLPVSGI
ncbi:MAG: hypothetical protein PHP51_09105 [Desulfotomaculaceae bacterium]|nr:hypothetical protein [Desulfotomaculaceae bacterium]MDD4766538.1 hypothetical protein [Desulfotomaculaceae bacterium]